MIVWPLLAVLFLPARAAVDKTHGVAPHLLSKYVPLTDSAKPSWKCLDGSKEISWNAVNDDYCDCLDGSDEPGTGACPNSTFYCRNEGHIGSILPASRVNDGLCEPECCDGSDEPSGLCPDICKEVGEAYTKRQEEERKIRKKGSKIRSSYISYAQKEKKKLEGTIETLTGEIVVREKEVERLKSLVDQSESLSAAALEHKKQSPLYASLITHSQALKSLQREHKKQVERAKALGDILDGLRTGYNPNYQDMAVLAAVRGWEEIAGLPHINDVKKDDGGETEDQVGATEENKDEEETLEEGMWSEEKLMRQLDPLLKTDYVSLLLEHEKHVSAPPSDSILYQITSYLPDELVPYFEAARDTVISWLELAGIIRSGAAGDKSSESKKLRDALKDAEKTLGSAKNQFKKATRDLDDLFDPEGFGPEGEWKKLEGTCISKEVSEYNYEVCFFKDAKQKPLKGGSSVNLGRYASWHPSQSIEPGDPVYYTQQIYDKGTKCWNGPNRNVKLVLTCGADNELLNVEELERCEYQFTATSPALCLPLDESSEPKKEEAEPKKYEL